MCTPFAAIGVGIGSGASAAAGARTLGASRPWPEGPHPLLVLSSSPAAAGVLGSVVYLGRHGEGIFECCQPPRSAVLTDARSAYGRGQVVRWLRRRFLIELMLTVGAQAVLPTVPALERSVTAQAGRGTGIGHTWGRCLVHRSCPRAYAEAMNGWRPCAAGEQSCINIKIDNFC